MDDSLINKACMNYEEFSLYVYDWFYNIETGEVQQWTVNDYTSTNVEYIEPVYLTEEILAMNGFDITKKFGCIFIKYNGEIVLRKEINEEYFYDTIFGQKVLFKYVHNLQHILRECGYKELANNLKIKK